MSAQSLDPVEILTRRTATDRVRPVDAVVIGGSVLAPVDVFLGRGLTVYDALMAAALFMLLAEGRLRLPPPTYLVAATIFTTAAAMSTFRATYPIEAFTQLAQYAFIFFVQVPVVVTVVRTRRAVLACMVLVSAGALSTILHAYVSGETQGADRAILFFSDNPNRLGYPAAFLLPFLVVFVVFLRRHSVRLHPTTAALAWFGCAATLGLSLWALVASASRSSLIGSVAALMVVLVLVPTRRIGRVVGRAAALVAVLLGVWLALASTGTLPETLSERIERSFEPEERGNMVGDRLNLASAGLRAFVRSPFVGTGLDNFRHVAPLYDPGATAQVPHNLWVQLLAQVGAVGALAFAVLLVWWFRGMWLTYRSTVAELDQRIVWSLVAVMTGTLTIMMVAPEMLDRHYWLFFALGLAAVDGLTNARAIAPRGASDD